MCITTKLRTLRLEYGVSLTELAERGGVSNQLISRMELGDVPRTEHKEELAAAALSGVIAAEHPLTAWSETIRPVRGSF